VIITLKRLVEYANKNTAVTNIHLIKSVFAYVSGTVKVEKPAKLERRIREVKKFEPINIDDYIQRLEGNLKLYVQQLQDET